MASGGGDGRDVATLHAHVRATACGCVDLLAPLQGRQERGNTDYLT